MPAPAIKEIARTKTFDGWQLRLRHPSKVTRCEMTLSLYLPPQAEKEKVPLLYWLSGLTCTDENFVIKAGAQRHAAEHGIALIAPDTSPRGEQIPDDLESLYDLGLGAGFYLTATQEPWKNHYQMERYITEELPPLLAAHYPLDTTRQSITGHSMGGHGALTLALKSPEKYRSVSAFAPICSPINCPWGQKALRAYLGDNRTDWRPYDTCALINDRGAAHHTLLIDQGTADPFLEEQLKPALLTDICQKKSVPLDLRMREGYDHSYHFIATYIGDHIHFHRTHL